MTKHYTRKLTPLFTLRGKPRNKTRSKRMNYLTNIIPEPLMFTNKPSAHGLGAFAIKYIPINTIILKEKPYNLVKEYDESYIYLLIRAFLRNKVYFKQFVSLVPIKIDLKDKTIISYDLLKDGHEKYLPELTKNQMILCYMKLKRNMFKFNNSPGICFIGTRINHSCDPNVTYYKDDNKLVFKTIKSINKDEELLESYINYDLPKSERQKLLLERYGFVCKCNKCMSEE